MSVGAAGDHRVRVRDVDVAWHHHNPTACIDMMCCACRALLSRAAPLRLLNCACSDSTARWEQTEVSVAAAARDAFPRCAAALHRYVRQGPRRMTDDSAFGTRSGS
eukprot:scaffold5586_cov124-Isochrysis_galbana.AAC.15